VTGINGNIGLFGIQLPIWLLITLGLISLILVLMNQRRFTSLPKLSFVVPWVISSFYVLLVFILAVSSDQMSIHIGPVLAAIGLGIGFASSVQELQKYAS
jgi:ABC-type sugar transport system permease subunit